MKDMDPQVKLLREAITMLDEFQISLPAGVAEEIQKGRAMAMVKVINAGDANFGFWLPGSLLRS